MDDNLSDEIYTFEPEENDDLIETDTIDLIDDVDESVENEDPTTDIQNGESISDLLDEDPYNPTNYSEIIDDSPEDIGVPGEEPDDIPDSEELPVELPNKVKTITVTDTMTVSEVTEELAIFVQQHNARVYAVLKDGTRVQCELTDIFVPDGPPAQSYVNQGAIIAAALNQHFWHNDEGAHVTDDTQDDWTAEYNKADHGELASPTVDRPWHNILMNSYGFLIRKGLLWLSQQSVGSTAFYDGSGNSANNVLAGFSGDGVQIGKLTEKHVIIDTNGVTAYNGDGTIAPMVAHLDGSYINDSTITNSKIVNGTIEGTKIANATIDNSNIKNGTIEGAKIASATIDNSNIKNGTIEGTKIASATIDNSNIKNGTIEGSKIAGATIDNSNIKDGTITGSKIQGSTLTDIPYAEIDELKSRNIAAESLAAAVGYISALVVQNITADNIIADHAIVDNLDVNYAHITQGVIDNAHIGYADVDDLDANYAKVNMSNVSNTWIESGTIKEGAISSAMINDLSANKLTSGTINAAEINVTNLRADNLKVSRVNGQPVIGGYELIDPSSTGYSSKNPKSQGWYELSANGYVLTNDTTVISNKAYYTTSASVELYDRTYIDNLSEDLNDRIDGAIETFTGTVVPTLNNAPASSWDTTKLRDQHVGDVYYVVNSNSEQNGYCYRFTKIDNAYSWQLIKDSDVTAALSRLQTAEGAISTIQQFDSDISSWKTDTDDELSSLKSSHTTLKTTVDKTLVSTVQLWFSKANTTAPNKPTEHVSSTSTNGNVWTTVVPAYNESYPNYYYCYEWKYADGTYGWSSVTHDIAMGESQQQARKGVSDAAAAQATANKNIKSSVQLWFTKANDTAPTKPTAKVTSDSTAGNAWRVVVPTYNTSYPHYFYCWQHELADGTYSWSDVIYDRATTENQSNSRSALTQVATKVETTTFNDVKQTVDNNSASINKLTTSTELALSESVEYIIGTQTAATGAWTGVTREEELKAGKTIAYKLPYAGSGNASLNLTLADGTTTGAIAVYTNTTRVTTHFGANAVIQMTYDGTYWRTQSIPNTNNYDRTLHNNQVHSIEAVATTWCIVVGTASGYRLLKAGAQFDLSYPILTNGAVWAANTNYANAYEVIPGVPIANTATPQGAAVDKMVYLKGTVNGNTFTAAATNFLTCVIPTEEDDFFYIPLGALAHNDVTKMWFAPKNQLHAYSGDAFMQVSAHSIKTSNRVSTIEHDIEGITTKVGNLETDVSKKADGTTVETLSNDYSQFKQDLGGFKTTVASTYATKTEASQVGQPNLAPIFSYIPFPSATVPNNTSEGYWHYWSIVNAITPLEDGWAHYEYNNTTTSTHRVEFEVDKSPAVEPGKDYTFLVEVRNVSVSGDASQLYLVQAANCQFWGGVAKKALEDDSASGTNTSFHVRDSMVGVTETLVKRYVKTSETVDDGHIGGSLDNIISLMRYNLNVPANSSCGFDARISLYEGEYTGPYKPYSGTQLYVTSERVTQAETTINQNKNDIALRATKAEASQMAQPNITPWFSMGCTPSESNGYWHTVVVTNYKDGNHFHNTGGDRTVSALSDGWAHVMMDSRSSAGNQSNNNYINTFVKLDKLGDIRESGTYTWLVEVRNMVWEGDPGKFLGIAPSVGNATLDKLSNTVGEMKFTEDGVARYTVTAKSDFTGVTQDTRGYMYIQKECYAEFDIRVSLYEGEYTGPYKPYVGKQLYASQAELKVANDAIDAKVDKDGVIAAINLSVEEEGGSQAKISADKVNIEGAAIFTSGKLSKVITSTQTEWYSSTSATSKAGGSWATTQPSVVAGRYIWERQKVTYSDNTSEYKPSSEGVCTQGQTNLSAYSTTQEMSNAIDSAVDGIQVGGRNLLLGTADWSEWVTPALNVNNSTHYFYITKNDELLEWADAGQDVTFSMDVEFEDVTASNSGTFRVYSQDCFKSQVNTPIGSRNNVDWNTGAATSALNLYEPPTNGIYHYTKTVSFAASHISRYALQVSIRCDFWSAGQYRVRNAKYELGNKATDWTEAPEDTAAAIEQSVAGQGGFTILWNQENFTNANNGEGYICAFDPTTGTKSDANGWVMWNGVKRTVPKGMVNPNAVHPYNTPCYIVCRLSSADATSGTNYIVSYNSGWKGGLINAGALSDWTWDEATDIIIGKYVEPASENALTEMEIYNPPLSSKQLTTQVITASRANATANAAAPKSSAVNRTQRIYYRKTSSGAPAANTTWLSTSGTGYGNWSLSIPPLTNGTTKYPYLYTAVQTQTVAQQAAGSTCSCSAVLLDDSTTVIDGGNIITGSVAANSIDANSGTFNTANIPELTANHIKANVIDAVNNGNGTINANKIAADSLTIGYSQLTGTPTIPSKVSQLTNDSQYATQTQAQGYATDAVDNLTIGGTNLLWNTQNLSANWGTYNCTITDNQSDPFGSTNAVLVTPSNVSHYFTYRWANHEMSKHPANGRGGSKFTFSVWLKADSSTASVGLSMRINNSAKHMETFDITDSWQRYTITDSILNTITNGDVVWVGQAGTDAYYVAYPKLEEGSKPTDWTPAPEDTDTAIESVQSIALEANRGWYAECTTAAATANKDATITPTTTNFSLTAGVVIHVKFDITNSAAVGNLTLNVNQTGAKSIKSVYNGSYNNIKHHPQANTTYEFFYNGQYWVMQENYNSDTVNRTRMQNVIRAIATANSITAGHIICGTASGYRDIEGAVSFDLSYPLLYAGSTVSAASGTGDNNFLQINGIKVTNNGTVQGAAQYKNVYLKGAVAGNIFTIAASNFLTCNVPTSEDNFVYIPLGMFYNSTTNIYFNSSSQLYAYKDGAFGPVSIREASAAAKTATNYIQADTDGIKIRMSNNATTYQHLSATNTTWYASGKKRTVVGSDGLTVYIGDTAGSETDMAHFGESTRIGKAYVSGASDNESHVDIDYHSLQLVSRENEPKFVVEDIRDHAGYATTNYTKDFYNQYSISGFQITVPLEVYSIQSITISYNGLPLITNVSDDDDSENPSAHIQNITDYGSVTYPQSTNFRFTDRKITIPTHDPYWPEDTSYVLPEDRTEEPPEDSPYYDNPYYYESTSDNRLPHISVEISYTTNSEKSQMLTFGSRHLTQPYGGISSVLGVGCAAPGYSSFASGFTSYAVGEYTHSEGYSTEAYGDSSHAEGYYTVANGDNSHTEGRNTQSNGVASHSEGKSTKALGYASHAEGRNTIANYSASHAEGSHSSAIGYMSHAEGGYTTASGYASHAEGYETTASTYMAHAEGRDTTASGRYSHAEGISNTAGGYASHAEGYTNTISLSADAAHIEGWGNSILGSSDCAHVEGRSVTATGQNAHAQNLGTIAAADNQTAIGKYNESDTTSALIIGNGESDDARSNALTVDWNGTVEIPKYIQLKSANLNRDDTLPSSLTQGNSRISFLDADSESLGYIWPLIDVTGANYLRLEAHNENSGGTQVTNHFDIRVDRSGNASYAMSNPAAFRTAIGLNRTQTDLTLSGTSAGTLRMVRNETTVSIWLYGIKLSAALNNGSAVTLGTIPSGYRPVYEVDVLAVASASGYPQGVIFRILAGGGVELRNRSGSSLAAESHTWYATATYVI